MQIHRIRGRDLNDALHRARKLHGADALVLTHEKVPGGVTVAVTDARERRSAASMTLPQPNRTPGLDGVERAMQRTGCSETLIAETLRRVTASGGRGAYALDIAARALATHVATAPSPKAPKGARFANAIAFVGPTGVGKTTTIAKLSSRLVQAGRRIGLVNLDTQRAGADLQLREYGKLLQVPVDTADSPGALQAILKRSRHLDLVLVDTSGHSPHDVQLLERMHAELAGPQTYLVASAATAPNVLQDIGRGFGVLAPKALVVTKLDETRSPAPILEFAAGAQLPVTFLCDGQDISGHLHRPTKDSFADLFLRGRLA